MKLLKETDEESLECLCRLMTTVGQELESETKGRLEKGGNGALNLRPIESYFREMVKIIEEKKTSSRVRFLMQDVVDLRNNRWQKRREDAGPKTLDQIHDDMKNEQLRASLNIPVTPSQPPSSRGRDQRDTREDPRKRSFKGTGGGQGEDGGWLSAPTRAAKLTGEKIDTNKLKNIVSKRENIEDIQLGPSSAKGGGVKWMHGSSGSKSSSRHEESSAFPTVPTIMQNRFSALSSSGGAGESSSGGGPPSSYDGRTSGGFSRPGRPGLSSGPTSSSSYMGRSSRGQSSENDKAKAIQVRFFVLFQTTEEFSFL